ncbi:MAG: hypothetical protein FWC50_07410 [Planctomycetaceae bacterium]|nr:hypothetical protein [Planctomycetaceae bacterium]
MSTEISQLQASVQVSAVDAGRKTKVDVEKLTRVFVIFWGWSLVIEGTISGLRNFVFSFPRHGFSEQNDMLSFPAKYILSLPFVLMFLFSGVLIGVLLICFNRRLAGFLKRRAGRPANSQTVTTWKFREIHALLLAVFGIWCVIRCAELFLPGCGVGLHLMTMTRVRVIPLPVGGILLTAVLVMSFFLPLIVWARLITRKINQIAGFRRSRHVHPSCASQGGVANGGD